MGEQKLTDTEREAADAKMVDDAFKRLLDRHTRECADSLANRISCTL